MTASVLGGLVFRCSALRLIGRPPLQSFLASASFKSSVHPDNLFPHAKYSDRFEPPKKPVESAKAETGFAGVIPPKELTITYSLSSGPGGQHANKNETRVDIRFHLDSANWLSDEVKAKVKEKISHELTKDGLLVVKSDRTRSRMLNQADALRKLRDRIWSCLEPEEEPTSEEELERRRKAMLRAARVRVREKRNRSLIKRDRKPMIDF